MKAIVIMAISINGITCLEDGSEDFLSDEGGDLNTKLIVEAGSLIWGRATYERVRDHYTNTIKKDLKNIPKVVVSRNPNYKVTDDYELADSPQAAVALLEAKGYKSVAVVGGSKLNAAFLEAGLVDEIVVDIEPVVVGKGLPLFAPTDIQVRTKLLSAEPVNDGELLLRYKVVQ